MAAKYRFVYNVSTDSLGKIVSFLDIYHLNDRNKYFTISYDLDLTNEHYKLIQHKIVVNLASKLLENKNWNYDNDLAIDFEYFGKSIAYNDILNGENSFLEPIFFYNSIINTALRIRDNNERCECTPYAAYFVDKSFFWCQEDFIISPKKILEQIDGSSIIYERDREIYDNLKKFKNYESLSIDKILSTIQSKEVFIEQVEKFYNEIQSSNNSARFSSAQASCSSCIFGICGGDLGCCGNYSGCCWFASYECLLHDAACLRCDKWHCGPACQPSLP